MATLYGVKQTLIRAGTKVEAVYDYAKLRVFSDTYAFTANPTDGDDLFLVTAKTNWKLLGGWIRSPALGTAGSVKGGWAGSGNDQLLFPATDVSATAFTHFTGLGLGTVFTADTDIFVDITNGGTASSGTFTWAVYLAVE